MDIRPRTIGEIYDDAWRLYLADAALLLAVSSVFVGPAAVVLLMLLATPPAANVAVRGLLPGLLALLVPVTGLGSACCQEVFRLRADGKEARLAQCLAGAWRRGLDHMAGRALVWSVTLLGSALVVAPLLAVGRALASGMTSEEAESASVIQLGLVFVAGAMLSCSAVLAGSATIHPILAEGEQRWFSAWTNSLRQTQRQSGKAAVFAFSRPVLWVLAVLNLHMLVRIGLWIGDDLAGFDWAVPSAVLAAKNPVYVTALVLLTGLLLAPFFEGVSYLLHVDARTRHEGLDLWYRVRRHFPAGDRSKVGVLLLVVGVILWSALPARAEDRRRTVIQQARGELATVSREVKDAKSYPGGDRWLPRLRQVAAQLDTDGGARPGGYRWFERGLSGFAGADREAALNILGALDARLALAEDSLEPAGPTRSKEEIKALLPPESDREGTSRPNKTDRERKDPKERVRRDDRVEPVPGRRSDGGSGVVGPRPDSGFGLTGWVLVVFLLIAVLVTAIILARRSAPKGTKPDARPATDEVALERLLAETDRPVGENLWRQADDLARSGRWLDGLRTLYLAVLALLHRADLIRYSQTRTNGEYLQQVRPRTEVYFPFEGLTELYELKWYGEKMCHADDYQSCRRLAEQVREGIKG